MHQNSFDLTVEEITKIEGNAGLDVKVVNNKVVDLKLKLADFKRFYTQSIRGKEALNAPQLLARICGTCSNAHLLCSIKSVENALNIVPSNQTKILRKLVTNGLIIRDHALHLYVFSLPDIFGKGSILEFDESDPTQHQLLHDTFNVKKTGNKLSVVFGGRSVHAPFPTVGGFTNFPQKADILQVKKLLVDIRPAVLRLINIFLNCKFTHTDDSPYMSLVGNTYDFLEGQITTNNNETIENNILTKLEHVLIDHSQASAYKLNGQPFMVGALPRINLNKQKIHTNTIKDIQNILNKFPSNNIFHNNLAQAIEILHCLDESLEILEKHSDFPKEELITSDKTTGVGIGVIEAPRGLLYHKINVEKNKITKANIIVPTGQNQLHIEKNLKNLIEANLNKTKNQISHEIEKFIRAYDPCISCATHFLKIKWS